MHLLFYVDFLFILGLITADVELTKKIGIFSYFFSVFYPFFSASQGVATHSLGNRWYIQSPT
jgi:hypothetical protein